MSSDTVKATAAAGRLPSLNQLAARININAPSPATNSSSSSSSLAPTAAAPRPRLAAFALRTGSTTSLSTTATNDSTQVNAPTTRSTSPTSLLETPPQSHTPSNDNTGGEPLTTEKLEKLNSQQQQQQDQVSELVVPTKGKAPPKGYKNIPSLDAITARLAKARALSIDGTAKPPDAEMIEDPKTPGVPMKAPEHPLQYPWTIYHDTKAKFPFTPATSSTTTTSSNPPSNPSSATPDGSFSAAPPPESTDYEAGLTVIGEFKTVEEFCRYFNWLKPPSKLERNSNYHLFKAGIKPMWEDPANTHGGKWVLTMKNNPQLLDRCWHWLAMALVGEELEDGDEICGAVVSLRSKVDRIQVWTRGKEDVEKLNSIGKKLVKLLDVSEADGIGLEFQYNTDDRPLPNKFLSIQAMPSTSYRASFHTGGPPSSSHARTGSTSAEAESPGPASAGGAFGSFGVGGIGGWRGQKGR